MTFSIGFAHRQVHAALLKRFDHAFGWNISNQRILRERTTAQSANGGIESAAAGVVSGENFRDGIRARRCAKCTPSSKYCRSLPTAATTRLINSGPATPTVSASDIARMPRAKIFRTAFASSVSLHESPYGFPNAIEM